MTKPDRIRERAIDDSWGIPKNSNKSVDSSGQPVETAQRKLREEAARKGKN
jgi:hypothetical protein